MQISGAMGSIESVQNWFSSAKTEDGKEYVFWTLYSGTEAKAAKILMRNEQTTDKIMSWTLLRDTLVNNSTYGGVFYVFLTTQSKHNTGITAIVSLPPQSMVATGAPAAVSGLPLGIGSLQEYAASIREKIELENRVKELETKKDDAIHPVISGIMNHPQFNPNVIMSVGGQLVNRIMGILESQMTGKTVIAVSGYPDKPEKPQNHSDTEGGQPFDNAEEAEEDDSYDGAVLMSVCNDLADIYPDVAPEIILRKLLNYLILKPENQPLLRSFVGF
jgi:hypothetical protein